MTNRPTLSRREAVLGTAQAAAAGLLALQIPLLASLAACTREEATTGDKALVHLSKTEAEAMAAFAARILPSDDGSPGANEAGVVYFVDQAFGMPCFADAVPLMRRGLADLDARARSAGSRDGFAALIHADQDVVMRDVEHSSFFDAARTLVVIGMFADPEYGGNRDRAGWKMLGMEHAPVWTAPFGWYDALEPGVKGGRRA